MDNKLSAIIGACFCAGAVTALLALVFAVGPLGLALSAIVGGAVGYFGYRPDQTWQGIVSSARVAFPALVDFFAKPRVLFWISALWGVCVSVGLQSSLARAATYPRHGEAVFWATNVLFAAIVPMAIMSFPLFSTLPIARYGGEKIAFARRWPQFHSIRKNEAGYAYATTEFSSLFVESTAVDLARYWIDALRPLPGLARIEAENALTALVFVALGLCAFVANVFRVIHRQARLMCMVDGPLGGIAAYALGQHVFAGELAWQQPFAQLAVVLAGGVAGIAFGYVNYKFVAPLLGEQPA